jgi:hypothetical protein
MNTTTDRVVVTRWLSHELVEDEIAFRLIVGEIESADVQLLRYQVVKQEFTADGQLLDPPLYLLRALCQVTPKSGDKL